jgi:hypothetical protein
VLAVLMMWRIRLRRRSDGEVDPLSVSLCCTAALTLFYHRYYDLVLLIPAAWGLLVWRQQHPGQHTRLWNAAMGTLLLLGFPTAGVGPLKALDGLMTEAGLLPVSGYACVLNTLLLILVLRLGWNPDAERETQPAVC